MGILCLGATGILGATVPAVASLEYFYAKDGTITGRCVNGKIQHYSYVSAQRFGSARFRKSVETWV